MKSNLSSVFLFVATTLITTSSFAQNWDEIVKALASDRAAEDFFGITVAIDGDYAIVGAYQEDENASGGATAFGAGSAYIYHRSGTTWTQQQKVVASDRAYGDAFGITVAIDGDYAIVGAYAEDENASGGATAYNAGSAYIYHRSGTTWTEQQKIVASDRASNDAFGWSLAINGDYAIVGAYGEDENAAGGATASGAGSAYIYHRSGTTWTQQQKIVASDRASLDAFGYTVAINGDYAFLGAFREDENASGGATASNAGSAYIFHRSGTTWTEQQKIVASDRDMNDNFGLIVAINGDYAIVGTILESEDASGGATAINAGSAYIYHRSGTTWTEQQKIVSSDRATNDKFGHSVSISGDYAIVGAFGEDENASGGATANNAGSAYIFHRSGTTWTEEQKIVASDRAPLDYFGVSVSISGAYAIVGAYREDENASGGATASSAGSSYIFGIPCVANTGDTTVVACDTYTWPTNSQTYSLTGAYIDTTTNVGGCDSVVTLNLAINSSNTGSQTETACESYSWPTNSQTYTSTGAYLDTLTNVGGCDSVVTLNLTINAVSDISTSLTDTTITANNTAATYQWLDCLSSYAPISGETNMNFVATANGEYAVELTENGCVDTSACTTMSAVGIAEASQKDAFTVYPNPSIDGRFTIAFKTEHQDISLTVFDAFGQLVHTEQLTGSTAIDLQLENQPAGIYLLNVKTSEGLQATRLVKH